MHDPHALLLAGYVRGRTPQAAERWRRGVGGPLRDLAEAEPQKDDDRRSVMKQAHQSALEGRRTEERWRLLFHAIRLPIAVNHALAFDSRNLDATSRLFNSFKIHP
jgi:hypothetical protein